MHRHPGSLGSRLGLLGRKDDCQSRDRERHRQPDRPGERRPAAARPPQTAGGHHGAGFARVSFGRTHSATPQRLIVASRANRLSLSSITLKAIARGFTAASHPAATPIRGPATAVPSRPDAQTAAVPHSTTTGRRKGRSSRSPSTPGSQRSSQMAPANTAGNPGGRIARRGKTPPS